MTADEVKPERHCDVLIIGAGMAGSCLALHLRRALPDLRVILIDKKASFDWWVGESTSEPFDHYCSTALGIAPYLTMNHLPKHGLRFFFDSKEKDLAVEEMSEIGRARYSGRLGGYQLDRSTFDRDMIEMNRANGVEVLLNTRVMGREGESNAEFIAIDGEKGHLVKTTAGDIRCKWLVDAAGRSSPLATKLGLVSKETQGTRGSYWARFSGFRSLDTFGDDAWRRRVGGTQRFLSTSHFMYDGYWIWHIPVSTEILSLGVTFDRQIAPLTMKNGEELIEFFRSHRALSQILGPDAKCLDFAGLKYLSRCADELFGEERWFLTGMSAMFVDPLLSNASSLFVIANHFIVELLKTDIAGDTARLRRLRRHFNIFMKRTYRTLSSELGTRYSRYSSFDTYAAWQAAYDNNYYNYVVSLHLDDYRAYIQAIESHDDDCGCSDAPDAKGGQAADGAIGRITDEYLAFVESRGVKYARNRRYFIEGTSRLSILENMESLARDRTRQRAEAQLTYRSCFRYFVSRMCAIEGRPFHPEAFDATFEPDWTKQQTLASVAEKLRAAAPPPGAPTEGVRWLPKGPVDTATAELLRWYAAFTGPDGGPA